MNAKAELETANVRAKKVMDWAISSQAPQECGEGSTTSAWSPERAVKRHECGARIVRVGYTIAFISNVGDSMFDQKFFAGKQELEATYAELKSAGKVAKRFGVSKKLVLRYMVRYGIERSRKTAEVVGEEIKSLATSGVGTKVIADRVGLSQTAVRRFAKTNGVVIVDLVHPGFVTTESGYIKVRRPEHPRASKAGYVGEHVLVMEAAIGRGLHSDECVHHKDLVKSNNELSNLQLMTKEEHRRHHLVNGDCGGWSETYFNRGVMR